MDIVGIIQARMGSSRLPGKVLRDVAGRPALKLQIDRLGHCRHLSRLVLAISDGPGDDPLAAFAAREGLCCFRGSEADVLDRIHGAALSVGAAHLCRITADCPLADPQVIDLLGDRYAAQDPAVDYVGGAPSYPEGMVCAEFLSFAALDAAWREAKSPPEREHVTLFVRNHPERFRLAAVPWHEDLGHVRVTLDEPRDLEVVRAVVAALGAGPEVGVRAVARFMAEHPEIHAVNRDILRNEGLRKSLEEAAQASPGSRDDD